MKNHQIYLLLFYLLLFTAGCNEQIPGKGTILSVEYVTHSSMVVHSAMTGIGPGVGLQFMGICLSKPDLPDMITETFTGTPAGYPAEDCLTGISGLEPDTKYVLRAYFETNAGTVYSDTLIIGTHTVDWMTDARDGEKYPVKQYGKQVWMVRNLNFETPGSVLCQFNTDIIPVGFGRLYPYMDAISACPSGWHLPADAEWKELEEFMGIPETELDLTAFRGSPAGGMMKEPGMRLWLSESALHSTNQSGFTIVPSGWYRNEKKEFTDPKTCAGFWVVAEDQATVYPRFFYAGTDAVSRNPTGINSFHLSVRCVKD